MKYIISESRLDEFKSSYLKSKSRNVEDFEEFITISSTNSENDEDVWANDVWLEYDREDGRLYVDSRFMKSFSDMFFGDNQNAYEYLTNWFENEFGFNVEYVES